MRRKWKLTSSLLEKVGKQLEVLMERTMQTFSQEDLYSQRNIKVLTKNLEILYVVKRLRDKLKLLHIHNV